MGHSGVATTAAKTRRRYWIIRVHDLVKTIQSNCVVCKEINPQVESQLMANLPPFRVAPPPFHYVSCEYFGPLTVKISRNKTTKHYGVIFTCLNTRAVHLEIATDCSAMEFIQTLRRFFSIRGYPAMIMMIFLPCFHGIRLWIWPEPLVTPHVRRALGTRMG
jgi:hypothetical protein